MIGRGDQRFCSPAPALFCFPTFAPHTSPWPSPEPGLSEDSRKEKSWPKLSVEIDAHLARVIYTLNSFPTQVR